jgi:hypothetical protein
MLHSVFGGEHQPKKDAALCGECRRNGALISFGVIHLKDFDLGGSDTPRVLDAALNTSALVEEMPAKPDLPCSI